MSLEGLRKELKEYEAGRERVNKARKLIRPSKTPAVILLIFLIIMLILSSFLLINLRYDTSIKETIIKEFIVPITTEKEIIRHEVEIRNNVSQEAVDYLNEILEKNDGKSRN